MFTEKVIIELLALLAVYGIIMKYSIESESADSPLGYYKSMLTG